MLKSITADNLKAFDKIVAYEYKDEPCHFLREIISVEKITSVTNYIDEYGSEREPGPIYKDYIRCNFADESYKDFDPYQTIHINVE